MAERSDFKPGTLIELVMPMTHSKREGWQSSSSEIIRRNVMHGSIIKFHGTVNDAVEIKYFIRGYSNHTYVHWRDLNIINEIPNSKPEAALFDVSNLDV